MIAHMDDTICAMSTAKGKGAIAIIRLSGPESIKIVDSIFDGAQPIERALHASMTYGKLRRRGSDFILDEVIVAKFEKPNSYTGQDLVEINCHGGIYVVQEILNELLKVGARLAEPGEFTRRAFINGKMDLLQVESIADVIDAQTARGLNSAQRQLSGILSEKLLSLKDQIVKQMALLEIELDFSEEDIKFASREEMLENVNGLVVEIEKLIASFRFGKILREGVHLVLAGKPNVGKSSILNRLLQEERAIVSDIPGTTRDVIEESLDIDGLLFKVSDTAGIRITKESVESLGVERTRYTLERADQILFIVDASEPLDRLDYQALELLNSIRSENILLLLNKIDIADRIDAGFAEQFQLSCRISAKTGEGFAEFKKMLVESNLDADTTDSGAFINKLRHRDALRKSREYLLHAGQSLEKHLSPEFVAVDIRAALDALGQVTGEVTTDDILNDIFSSFCIGK